MMQCASFLNIQPYRFIHDKDKMILVSLESEVTDFKDFKLNIGIVMLHFAAVMSRQNNMIKGWVLEAPEKDYNLPEGAVIEGYCNI